MKTIILATLAAAAALNIAGSAQAEGGCGRGFHRGPYGACRPNGRPGPLLIAPGALAIGAFYPGRGYWDGHRYWANRARRRGGWRYH